MSFTLRCRLGNDPIRNPRNGKPDGLKRFRTAFDAQLRRRSGWEVRKSGVAAVLAIGAAGLLALDASPAKAVLLTTGAAPNTSPFGGSVCADVSGNSLASPTNVQAWDCLGGPNQQFELYGWTVFTEGAHLCLDVFGGGTTPGTRVVSATCNGTGAQQWYYADGFIVNYPSKLCLDATNLANGTQLIINTCNSGSVSQQWQLK